MYINGTTVNPTNANTSASSGAKSSSASSVSFNAMLQEATGTEKSNTGTASISTESRWQQIAGKYDVTNISTRERGVMAAELMDNNLISSAEGMALEFSRQNGGSSQQVELQEKVMGILEKLIALNNTTAGTYANMGSAPLA